MLSTNLLPFYLLQKIQFFPPEFLLFLLSLITGCTIPLDESPRDLSSNLPDALLPPASTTTQPPTPKETVKIFLAKANLDGEMKLEPVNREISGDGSINVILDQVLAGPTLTEQETQLVSPFAEGSKVIGAILENALLEIHCFCGQTETPACLGSRRPEVQARFLLLV